MEKARLLLLDVIGKTGFHIVECGDLEDYYKHLKCSCFDMANRKVGDKRYDIFVDDNGLFADEPIPSVIDESTNTPMLVGNAIFANHDDEGNTTSLSDDDISNIMSQGAFVVTPDDILLLVRAGY